MIMSGTAGASGGVNGFIRLQPDLGFTVMAEGGSRGAGDRGAAGVGWSIGGEKRKGARSISLHLISRAENLGSLSDQEIEAWYRDGVAPSGRDVFLMHCGEDGRYEFGSVPAGEYFLVIVTNAMSGMDMAPKTSRLSDELQAFLPSWDSFQLFAIGMNQYAVQSVSVSDGVMTRLDYDFASPPFAEK